MRSASDAFCGSGAWAQRSWPPCPGSHGRRALELGRRLRVHPGCGQNSLCCGEGLGPQVPCWPIGQGSLPSTEAALGSLPLGLLYRVALCSVEATGATSSKVLADWSGPPRITSPLINPEPSHPWPNPRSGIACTHWPHLPRAREGAHQVGMVGRLSFLPTAAPHEHARTNA